MATERTLSIIKPDATRRNLTGKINARFEDAGLRIVAQRRLRLTKEQAGEFYAVHAERSFFTDLCAFMTSGPVVVQVLEGDNAVARNREIMGATNPANAAPGTIRADFAESVEANSVHGSEFAGERRQRNRLFFRQDGHRRLRLQLKRTSTISYDFEPLGVLTSTESPMCLPIKARASGECTDRRPDRISASWAPTI